MKTHQFTIDLSGIINVLGDNLYSTPEVYIRELLQNSVDAIRMREEKDNFEPEVVLTRKETKIPQLVFRDNGIGLTEEEIHAFLATIGNSSKRDSSDADVIGQFGIGLLSAFVVSDTITLHTRSAKQPSVVTKWVGKKDGTYTIETVKKKMEIGTEVTLKASKKMEHFYDQQLVEDTVKYYSDFLPFPVRWDTDTDRTINRRYTPLEVADLFSGRGASTATKKKESLLKYGEEHFETTFLDAFEIQSAAGGVRGIAFVVPYAVQSAAKHTQSTVYLKRMLVSDQENQLLPEWAFFLETVFFVDDLIPTASREGFQKNDMLEETQKEIGQSIIQYLTNLATQNREAFDVIIRLHDVPFKALALENEDFYKQFVKMLPFETSMGRMLLEEYLEHSKEVRYTTTVQDFHQMSAVANAEQLWMINGGYVYDSQLLARLPEMFPGITSTVFESVDIVRDFEDVTVDERARTNMLITHAQKALAPFECAVTVRKFAPHALPAMYMINEEGRDRRAFQQANEHHALPDHMKELMQYLPQAQQVQSAAIQLCLNWSNKLVQKLSSVENAELIQQIVRLLYIQSLLQAQKPLRPIETAELNMSLMQLIDQIIDRHE
jgi:molecular chaperone HtpG